MRTLKQRINHPRVKVLARRFLLAQEELQHKGLKVIDWHFSAEEARIEAEIEDTETNDRGWISVGR